MLVGSFWSSSLLVRPKQGLLGCCPRATTRRRSEEIGRSSRQLQRSRFSHGAGLVVVVVAVAATGDHSSLLTYQAVFGHSETANFLASRNQQAWWTRNKNEPFLRCIQQQVLPWLRPERATERPLLLLLARSWDCSATVVATICIKWNKIL